MSRPPFPCGHPRDDNNIRFYASKQKPYGVERCRTCANRYAREGMLRLRQKLSRATTGDPSCAS